MANAITKCVGKLFKAGLITRQQGHQILQQQARAIQAGVANPSHMALNAAKQTIVHQKWQAALQAAALHDIMSKAGSHQNGWFHGSASVMVRDTTENAQWGHADFLRVSVSRRAYGPMMDAIADMKTSWGGLHADDELREAFAHELAGVNTGNAKAARAAKQVADVMEELRLEFNKYGGNIPKRADWWWPQRHNAALVSRAAGGRRFVVAGKKPTVAEQRDAWKAFISPLIDRQRMISSITGLPLTVQDLSDTLDELFETITTRGLNHMDPAAMGGKKLANQHADPRFLLFKDVQSRLAYDKRFGDGDVFNTVLSHTHEMAGDIAMIRTFGPNPRQGYKVLRATAKKNGVTGIQLARLDAMYHTIGGTSGAAQMSPAVVAGFRGIRNTLTGDFMGSAILSTPSDFGFIKMTTAWTGLDFTRFMDNYLHSLNPANADARAEAGRHLVTVDGMLGTILHNNRYSELAGTGVTAKFADFTVRATGLVAETQAKRQAIQMSVLMKYASLSKKAFADLPDANRRVLELSGIEEADWDILRLAPQVGWNKHNILALEQLLSRPGAATDGTRDAVDKMLMSMEHVSHYAIPTPDARSTSLFALAGETGTLPREVANMMAIFKGFPLAVLMTHLARVVHIRGAANKLKYMGMLTIYTTLLGALSVQLKEITKGRSPRDMNDVRFWAAAYAQGGGLGIFGDYIYSGLFGRSRVGGTFAEAVGGPVATAITDIGRLTTGNFGEILEGQDTNFLGEAVQFAGRYTPFLSSAFYTKLVWDREVISQLQMMADPRARERFQQDRRRRKTQFGQYDWWRRGEATPEVMQQ